MPKATVSIPADDLAEELTGLMRRLHLLLPRANGTEAASACIDSIRRAVDALEGQTADHTGLDSLPIDVLARIVSLSGATHGTSRSWLVTARAACVSHAMRLASDICWKEHALDLLPPTLLPPDAREQWLGFELPRTWNACLRSLSRALSTPQWKAFSLKPPPSAAERLQEHPLPGRLVDATTGSAPTLPCRLSVRERSTSLRLPGLPALGPPPGSSAGVGYDRWAPCLALPRKMFAHTSVAFEGKVYVFGGRDAQRHSNALDVLDLAARPLRWETVPESEATPTPRRQHTACVDSRGRMHVVRAISRDLM